MPDHAPPVTAVAQTERAPRVVRARKHTRLSRFSLAGASTAITVAILGIAGLIAAQRLGVGVKDLAILENRISVITDQFPLLGSYSRYGFDHPGPAQLYFLAIPYHLFGAATIVLALVTLGWQLGMSLLSWRVAHNRDVLLGMLALLGAVILLFQYPNAIELASWWNPWVGVVGTFTLVFLAWDAALLGKWGAVAFIPLASYLVQAHLGYAITCASLTVAVVCILLLRRRRADRSHVVAGAGTAPVTTARLALPWRHWLVGLALGLLLWLPPIWQELSGDSNVVAILGRESGDAIGAADASRFMASAFELVPNWFGPDVLSPISQSPIPVLLILPVAGTVVAWRRRRNVALVGLVLGWTAALAAWLSTAMLSDLTVRYLTVWAPASVMALLVMGTWPLLELLPADPVRRVACLLPPVAAAALLVSVMTAPPNEESAAARASIGLASELAQDPQLAGGAAVYLSHRDAMGATVTARLVLELRRRGIDAYWNKHAAELTHASYGADPEGKVRLEVSGFTPTQEDEIRSGADVAAVYTSWDQQEAPELLTVHAELALVYEQLRALPPDAFSGPKPVDPQVQELVERAAELSAQAKTDVGLVAVRDGG